MQLTWDEVAAIPDDAPLRCADVQLQKRMVELMDEKREAGDTLAAYSKSLLAGCRVLVHIRRGT